jgi:DNA polymerase-1
MIAEKVIAGNLSPSLSLNDLASRRLNERKKIRVSQLIELGIPVDLIPDMWLEDYCQRDVDLTRRIFLEQRQELAAREQTHLLYARCLLTRVLADMEHRGLQLDSERVLPLLAEKERAYAETQTALTLAMGVGVNPNSPKQLGEYLYDKLGFEEPKKRENGKWIPDRTASGRRKTDEDTLLNLTSTTKEQESFISSYRAHRAIHSELSKYLRKFGECCQSGGLLRAAFNQTRTATHRLSSSGLDYTTQLQNLPRQYKKLFKARNPGWLIAEVDGAQLEFRVAAHLGRDAVAIADIVAGLDVHSKTAEILGTSRQDAKSLTFKPLYGGRTGTPREQAYFAYFRDRYKGIAETQDKWINEVLTNKKLRTEYGLEFYWSDTRMERSGYIRNTTSICNFPVQGFATAEIIPLSVVALNNRIRELGLQMFVVNTIHDSIIVELPPSEREQFLTVARTAMIDDTYRLVSEIYGITLCVPLGCGIKIGEHWGEGEELKFEANKELYS